MNLSILPRRTPRRARHAAGSQSEPKTFAAALAGMPGDVTPAARPLTAPPFTVPLEFPPAAAEDPATTEALAPLREKLAETGPADTEILQKVIDGLRNLDKASGASLRCITQGGTNPHIPLRGFPSFAGVTRLEDGTPMAGLWLDVEDEDGRLVIDALSVAWLGRLIDEAEKARERLYAVLNAAPGEAADGSEAA